MSNGPLTDRPKTELAVLARRRGIRGWDTMNKGDLLKALSRGTGGTKLKPTKPVKVKAVKSAKPLKSPTRPARPAVKAAAKVTAKRLTKPAAKSAAKVTKPATRPAKSLARPIAKPAVAKSAVNGLHRQGPGANGSAKTVAKPVPVATKSVPVAAKPTGKAGAPPAKPSNVKGATPPAPAAAPIKELPPRLSGTPTKDRIFLAVIEPYWLHVMWDLSAHSVQRAEAALRQDWYGAKLIIRLSDVTSQDTTSTSETPVRDIAIDSDGRNWYIHVPQPPRQYRVDIGYLSRRGDFFVLARSNVVTPPKAGSSEALDAGWEKDPKKAERILAMSTGFESTSHPELKALYEERFRRPLGAPKETGFGTGATLPGALKKFFFEIDAKLIVFGRTDPAAHLTLNNDPIKLNPDGTFRMTFNLPDSRQIIPAVAASADGVEERTIVLAVERNTKHLDPMIHDQMNEV
jgi:hypothetical protein